MSLKRIVRTSLLALLLGITLLAATSCFSDAPHDLTSSERQSDTDAVQIPGVPAVVYDEDAPGPEAISGQLRVRFIDVGQGDCALISCNDEHLLIDGGPASASSKLYSILDTLGIDNLDCIIATHPDADHCGGIAGALNRATCSVFYCSVAQHDTKTFQNIVKYLDVTPITIPRVGDAFTLGDAQVSFVGPISSYGADTNNGSLVCRIDFGTTSFLFAGDAEYESEATMVAARSDLDCDVLKVGHHGSATSSSAAFLEAASPDVAIISVGRNSYGHPAPETLDRLAQMGTDVMQTDICGSIIATSDGRDISFMTTRGNIVE